MIKLSHYTSETGLIGIVRSQGLRATEFLRLNDPMEFTYALSAIQEEALKITLSKIPPALRDPAKSDLHLTSMIPEYFCRLREQAQQNNGYGSLYVTSFARGRNDSENEQGIPALWDRYTHNSGFCLQFEQQGIRRLVEYERSAHTYAVIKLAEVTYGICRQDPLFQSIVDQISRRSLQDIYHLTHDLSFAQSTDLIEVESVFIPKLLDFCARHKDPKFADEQEIRVLAYPQDVNSSAFLTGLCLRKGIHCADIKGEERRFILLGENIIPGFIPSTILVGPQAELQSSLLEGLYPLRPIVKRSNAFTD